MFNDVYKQALENIEKFWNRENTGRCALAVYAPLEGKTWYREPSSLEERWLDEEYRYQKYKSDNENMYYGADATPTFFTNFGPGDLAACIGGGFVLRENTVWFDGNPIITDWNNMPDIKFYEDSEMWGHITRVQDRFLRGRDATVSVSDIGGILDIAASLRGTEDLLMDLYDSPEQVKALADKITGIWLDVFDRQVERVGSIGLPYNTWMNIPSSKPWFPLQCDFSAMISPSQFEEFVLPGLIKQVEHMERSIYHLDGPGEIPHLDMLLDIPGLTGIQWVAGTGNAELWEECWFDMYKKIQDKKKNLVLHGGIPGGGGYDAERVIKTLDPTGLTICTGCANQAEADRLIEDVCRWSN